MKKITSIYFITALALISFAGKAQSIKMRIANHEYSNMRYADATVQYEQILLKDKNNVEAMMKLADCYRRSKDSKSALKLYAQLANLDGSSPKIWWYYAQALASNGYYSEASIWYEKYAGEMINDLYAERFVRAYENMPAFYRDSADYQVQYVPSLNSWVDDFSPTYYNGGLIFLSNRTQQVAIRRTFELDQTSFLDYYFMPDTAEVYAELQRPASYFKTNAKNDQRNGVYTIHTSNDNHTVGEYGKLYRYDTAQYQSPLAGKVVRVHTGNSTYHDGPVAFNKEQNVVFFTRNVEKEKRPDGPPVSHFDIFTASLIRGEWKQISEVPFNEKAYSTGHPALSPDNKKFYFASNRPGGKGGADIYVVDYDHGAFSEPVNVAEINTPDDEVFPYVDEEGSLYFSSNGWPGLGGLDLFKAIMRGNDVVGMENMGVPFNSGEDDFGIIWNKEMNKGFFSSNRKRGLTDDDIYAFEKLCRTTKVTVLDSITHLPLDSAFVQADQESGFTDGLGQVEFCMKGVYHTFSTTKDLYEGATKNAPGQRIEMLVKPISFDIKGVVYSPEDNQPMDGVRVKITNMDIGTSEEIITGKDGVYHFKLSPETDYTVTASKKNCGTHSIDKTTRGLKKTKTLKGDMDILCQGDIIRVDNIYYDLNKYNIRPDAAKELDKLVAIMNQYPDMRIELRSHTDSRSNAAFNMRLSTNRAQSVVEYLATQGIVPFRMRASGYGETLLVNKCKDGIKCSEEEHQQNRRTEFKVLSIK